MNTLSQAAFGSQTKASVDLPAAYLTHLAGAEPAAHVPSGPPLRPAWIEIDLNRLRRNFELINRHKSSGVQVISVLKDEAYGHGALQVAQTALNCGASFLALSTLQEALTLRDRGIHARLLLLGDRQETELPWCVAHDLTCCVSESASVAKLDQLAARAGKRIPVHLKINTGMNRYGVRWGEAASLASLICSSKALVLEGVFSHFSQSDETDSPGSTKRCEPWLRATFRQDSGTCAIAADFLICRWLISTWFGSAFCHWESIPHRFAGAFQAWSR
jgi:alanine racemase